MRLGKAGDGVDQQQNVLTLIAEMFGHGHCGLCGPSPGEGRLVGCCADHHRPRKPFDAQHFFGEVAQLAPAFADQRQHDDIGLDPFGEVAQKHGFAHA